MEFDSEEYRIAEKEYLEKIEAINKVNNDMATSLMQSFLPIAKKILKIKNDFNEGINDLKNSLPAGFTIGISVPNTSAIAAQTNENEELVIIKVEVSSNDFS